MPIQVRDCADEAAPSPTASRRHWWTSIVQWFDASAGDQEFDPAEGRRIDWLRCLPFLVIHLGCLGVIWTGWSLTAVVVAVALYLVRMFAITGFYHRYFSHRTFRAGRVVQFLFAMLGNSAAQRGPLWWAAHHRAHHRHSDEADDIHSPHSNSLLWSHMLWFFTRRGFRTDARQVPDWMRYPELRWLDRFDAVVPTALGVLLFLTGWLLGHYAPGLGTNGWQMVVWGFCISTVTLFHGTAMINSMAHLLGRRRYKTSDHSRNSLLLALITLGEGWHNNHHHYPAATRQGFFWWEVDITYYILKLLACLGIVSHLQPVPLHVREQGRRRNG